MYSKTYEDIIITQDDLHNISLFIHQKNLPVSISDIYNFLSKETFILKLIQKEIFRCTHCNNICIGIENLAKHIIDKHPSVNKDQYYKDARLSIHNLKNINLSDPPTIMYFCGYCDFPTSNSFGINPSNEMFRHIEKECPKATGIPRRISFKTTNDIDFIRQYISITKESFAYAKICTICNDKIFGTEQSAMVHYLERHCNLQNNIVDLNKIKEIFYNPSAYTKGALIEYEELLKIAKEYLNEKRMYLEVTTRDEIKKTNWMVNFSDRWLPKDMMAYVDVDKIAENLEQYPDGLPTSGLVDLISDEIIKKEILAFSICYQLLQNSNFTYNVEQDIWSIKSNIFIDSPEDDELFGRRSPGPKVHSTIKLEDEDTSTDFFIRTDLKEIDMSTWKKIKKEEISYILFFAHIYRGFLPYDKKAQRLFPPNIKRVCFVTDSNKKFNVKIDRSRKAIYSGDLKKFFQDSIAGTIIYIARLDLGRNYRIYFRENPQIVKDCYVAKYDEIKKEVVYEHRDLEVKYECVPPIFKAELRFQDIKALWEEARRSGLSISDLVYLEFSKMTEGIPDKTVHFHDVYARVFFKRMCSPGGVWSILKKHPSYYRYKGDKFWMFVGGKNQEKSKNIHRTAVVINHLFIRYAIVVVILLCIVCVLIKITMR